MQFEHDPETMAAAVFTYKSLETIVRDGGTQSWRLAPWRIGSFKHVIVSRCRTQYTPEDDLPHRFAFLLGRVSDIVPSTEPHHTDGRGDHRRWLFRISEAAELKIDDFWQFGRWTTIVRPLEEFGINPADYVFKPLAELLGDPAKAVADAKPALAERARRSVSDIIAEHKASMSDEIGVPEDRIDISIRF